jgi:hypothetical protein
MYGDPQHLRDMSAALGREGDHIRACARQLGQRARDVQWQSAAAGAMRRRADEQVRACRLVAGAFDHAATAVQAHAEEVSRRLAQIRTAETEVRALLAGAAGALAPEAPPTEGAGRATGPLPPWLATTELPPPGHRDWLALTERLSGTGAG